MQILEHLLKIRREKAKQEFWQTVGNKLATIWHCEIGIANFALRISHCEILQPQNTVHLSHTHPQILSEISHCEFRNVVCEIRNSLANFATALRNSQPCEQFANRLRISQSHQNSHYFALRFCFAHNFFIRTPF